ncbi:MAG: peptidase S41, partial [Flavobacteriales bacterium]|nr:peptidase S41 [Flavobacteriales bacterium]
MKKLLYSAVAGILLLIPAAALHAQECDCASNYQWLKKTIEQNDAGYQYVVDSKGIDAYKAHCAKYAPLAKEAQEAEACAEVLAQWLKFFRNGHLWIGVNQETGDGQSAAPSDDDIRKQFAEWPKHSYKEREFQHHVEQLKTPTFEGIWMSPPYEIGIMQEGNRYVGFIIEADGVYWQKDQVKLEINTTAADTSAVYYMKNHSSVAFDDVKLVSDNYLQIGDILLERKSPRFPGNDRMGQYMRLNATYVPLFERLSPQTCLIRIPSFSFSEKVLIDSLLEEHWDEITSTEHLIIDVRNNGGGSDISYNNLLPLIYTNPFRTVGVEFLSTPLNNRRMEEFMNDPAWSEEDRAWAREALKALEAHPGEFVNLESSRVSIEELDSVYTYPRTVGIIINHGNGSTTEQFLLAAKQSQKVKLFGTTTVG